MHQSRGGGRRLVYVAAMREIGDLQAPLESERVCCFDVGAVRARRLQHVRGSWIRKGAVDVTAPSFPFGCLS